MNATKRCAGARVVIALLLALCACLIYCENNTPLGPSIGSDNAMYLTMGTALAHGYAPYTQIFDHKGPLLFVLQTIPQLFGGGYQTVTVFLMEWLFLTLSLLTVDALCARLHVKGSLAVQLLYLAVMMPCMDGGNLTEEYANLFTLPGLWLILRVFGDDDEETRPFLPAMALGALAMLAFLTRANNALPLLSAVFGVTLFLLINKRFKMFFACVPGFLMGCVLALIPILIWLASRGALCAAFYASITHNLMYSQTGDSSRVAALLYSSYGHMAMLMAALASLGALYAAIRTRRLAVPMAMFFGALGAGAAAFISHKFYTHYLMIGAPMAALGAAQTLSLISEKRASILRAGKAALALACVAGLLISGYAANTRRVSDRAGLDRFALDAQALYAQVPEQDRDSFMAYRVEPKWYVFTEALPCMRFYFLQEILGQADPRVMDEIASTFEQNPPRWLVIFYNRPFSPPYDERVQSIIDARYEFVDARGEYQLLHLVDQK